MATLSMGLGTHMNRSQIHSRDCRAVPVAHNLSIDCEARLLDARLIPVPWLCDVGQVACLSGPVFSFV